MKKYCNTCCNKRPQEHRQQKNILFVIEWSSCYSFTRYRQTVGCIIRCIMYAISFFDSNWFFFHFFFFFWYRNIQVDILLSRTFFVSLSSASVLADTPSRRRLGTYRSFVQCFVEFTNKKYENKKKKITIRSPYFASTKKNTQIM